MSTARELVVATRNAKKCAELRDLLEPAGILVRSVAEFADVPEVIEDGATFAANAAKKAQQTARCVGRWTLGEDSGLEVAALGGAPGVFSARYSGDSATDASNNAKLISALEGVPDARRDARYVCHIAVADPDGSLRLTIERTCRGRIIAQPRGNHGFGYDPHFLIPEYHRTFGELSPRVKRRLSHRGRALATLLPAIRALLADDAPAVHTR